MPLPWEKSNITGKPFTFRTSAAYGQTEQTNIFIVNSRSVSFVMGNQGSAPGQENAASAIPLGLYNKLEGSCYVIFPHLIPDHGARPHHPKPLLLEGL